MTRRVLGKTCLAVVVLLMVGAGEAFQTVPGKAPANPAAVAAAVADGVGTVQIRESKGAKTPIVVFEEYHTSRVGQLEIAVMLLRLHERHGLGVVGLEGAFQRPRPLDATWFHNAGGPTARAAREDVAVRMLAEGEISSAEFMTLLFPNVSVFGTELEEQYKVRLETEGNPQVAHLLAIAQKRLTQADIRRANELLGQKKQKEAFEHVMTADPWIRERYEALRSDTPTSIRVMTQTAQEIQDMARKVGATVDPKTAQELQKVFAFYKAAGLRSMTMVNYVGALAAKLPGAPIAMIIGAAHTEEVADLYRQQMSPFAVIRPIALNPQYAMLTTEQFRRKNDLRWTRINPGTLGKLLNPARKPPPIIETATAKSYASANLAGMLFALAARRGAKIPDDVSPQVKDLPELKIDHTSFTVDGPDVIYRMFLTKTDGTQAEVWARVGSAPGREQARTLEQKLLQAIADLGGGGSRIPPSKPPANSSSTKDEGPGDGKRGDIVISRTGLETLAVYGSTKADVTNVGRISG